MITFEVRIDASKEPGYESIACITLQDAWDEFVRQVEAEQQDNYPCSQDGGDGMILRIVAIEDCNGNDGKETVIFQYDNRYGTDCFSLMFGNNEEAIIDTDDLAGII